jgi:N12 class adenine-specific DNA methylase
MDQLLMTDIKKMTVTELKSLISERKWKPRGIRLKAEYQQFIITSSYVEAQLSGIVKMKAFTLS